MGETLVDGVRREILEETGTTLEDPRLLGVLENIYVFDGRPGHEIVFVHTGRLADPDVVGPDGGWLADNGDPIRVEWRPYDDAGLDLPLYPQGLGGLLER
jgi:ADP-ribose pyrophosphatase YjhB (NUDIX family)